AGPIDASRRAPRRPGGRGWLNPYRPSMSVASFVFKLRRVFVVVLHLAVIPAGYYLAFALRFDGAVPPDYVHFYWGTVWWLLGIRVGTFMLFGLFHGWWRHVGMSDLVALVKAVTTSS